jgi:hypothetical protein
VRREQQCRPSLPQGPNLLQAAVLEVQVAHGEQLVDQQDPGWDLHRDPHRQTQLHPLAVAPDRRVGEGLEFGELEDGRKPTAGLRLREPGDQGGRYRVLATAERDVECVAERQKRPDVARVRDAPASRTAKAGSEPQQRGLARAVVADDPQALARLHLELDIAQDPALVAVAHQRRKATEDDVLGRPRARRPPWIRLPDSLEADGRRHQTSSANPPARRRNSR